MFKAFEMGQIGPKKLAKMHGGAPRVATIHEYLDWTFTCAAAETDGELVRVQVPHGSMHGPQGMPRGSSGGKVGGYGPCQAKPSSPPAVHEGLRWFPCPVHLPPLRAPVAPPGLHRLQPGSEACGARSPAQSMAHLADA